MADYEPDACIVAALEFVLTMDQYITRMWGERCPDYEADCCVCTVWKKRDDLAKFICD
jgi:hypothetical protein